MGLSVFGAPITEATVRGMSEYKGKNSINQQDRAKVAMEKIKFENKTMDALTFVKKLQSRFGSDYVSTMCLVYNGTGETMTFVAEHDWSGRVCECAYPVIIANGQWGGFLHGQRYGEDRSSGAGVVYSALNNEGVEKHWFFGFSNSIGGDYNQVYTEIRDVGHYEPPESEGSWPALDELLAEGKLVHQAKEEGGYVSGSIGNTAFPVFEAILTLPEALSSSSLA